MENSQPYLLVESGAGSNSDKQDTGNNDFEFDFADEEVTFLFILI